MKFNKKYYVVILLSAGLIFLIFKNIIFANIFQASVEFVMRDEIEEFYRGNKPDSLIGLNSFINIEYYLNIQDVSFKDYAKNIESEIAAKLESDFVNKGIIIKPSDEYNKKTQSKSNIVLLTVTNFRWVSFNNFSIRYLTLANYRISSEMEIIISWNIGGFSIIESKLLNLS